MIVVDKDLTQLTVVMAVPEHQYIIVLTVLPLIILQLAQVVQLPVVEVRTVDNKVPAAATTRDIRVRMVQLSLIILNVLIILAVEVRLAADQPRARDIIITAEMEFVIPITMAEVIVMVDNLTLDTLANRPAATAHKSVATDLLQPNMAAHVLLCVLTVLIIRIPEIRVQTHRLAVEQIVLPDSFSMAMYALGQQQIVLPGSIGTTINVLAVLPDKLLMAHYVFHLVAAVGTIVLPEHFGTVIYVSLQQTEILLL